MTWVRFSAAVETGKVRLKSPSEEASRQVEACAIEVGDSYFLSETDKKVLALALELKSDGCNPLVVSDDYSIQNVAKRLGIQFTSLATFGIRRVLEWKRYCPACRQEYAADFPSNECIVCGTKLKRKPRRH